MAAQLGDRLVHEAAVEVVDQAVQLALGKLRDLHLNGRHVHLHLNNPPAPKTTPQSDKTFKRNQLKRNQKPAK